MGSETLILRGFVFFLYWRHAIILIAVGYDSCKNLMVRVKTSLIVYTRTIFSQRV